MARETTPLLLLFVFFLSCLLTSCHGLKTQLVTRMKRSQNAGLGSNRFMVSLREFVLTLSLTPLTSWCTFFTCFACLLCFPLLTVEILHLSPMAQRLIFFFFALNPHWQIGKLARKERKYAYRTYHSIKTSTRCKSVLRILFSGTVLYLLTHYSPFLENKTKGTEAWTISLLRTLSLSNPVAFGYTKITCLQLINFSHHIPHASIVCSS